MMGSYDLYIAWLNDAYAMEKSIEETLERHAEQASEFPHIRSRIEEHILETRSQATRVKACIERDGASVSSVKSTLGNVVGMAMGLSTAPARDRLVKNALAEFATEHLEIAAYTAIIEAARELRDGQTEQICREIIEEEQRMAEWLMQALPEVSQAALRQ
jgi:ferritin-like metal-binding protein YciE